MAASAARSSRIAFAAAAVLVAVGLSAASARSQGEPPAELYLVTAGPGTLTVAPAELEPSAVCEVDAQEYQVPDTNCVHRFPEGTTVTLTAEPKPGHSFFGWSDFKCARASQTCTMTLGPGARYVAARFSPVTLKILEGEKRFGSITVKPKPSRACAFDYGSPCEYAFGTTVTLSRSRSAPGFFWIGACEGNRAGRLDAATCTVRLHSNEIVGAGYANRDEIPPPLGSGISIRLGGKGRGTVTGRVINGSKTLSCGKRCLITGLTRYDYIRLNAQTLGRSRFDRWSDGSRLRKRVIGLASTNRLWAKFDRR